MSQGLTSWIYSAKFRQSFISSNWYRQIVSTSCVNIISSFRRKHMGLSLSLFCDGTLDEWIRAERLEAQSKAKQSKAKHHTEQITRKVQGPSVPTLNRRIKRNLSPGKERVCWIRSYSTKTHGGKCSLIAMIQLKLKKKSQRSHFLSESTEPGEWNRASLF